MLWTSRTESEYLSKIHSAKTLRKPLGTTYKLASFVLINLNWTLNAPKEKKTLNYWKINEPIHSFNRYDELKNC